jgi:hypothetical protein
MGTIARAATRAHRAESTLREVGDLLRRAEQQCREAATGIAPEIRPGETACERYTEALADWPGHTQPSYERIARLLLSQVHQLEGVISMAIMHADVAAGLMAPGVEDTRLDRDA